MHLLSTIGLLLALGASCSPPRPGVAPEHVLLITVSGVRADHLGAWMYPRPTSGGEPGSAVAELSVDGLAASGVRFARAFAPSAASAASLAVLLTGRASPPADALTLVAAFRARGFRTAAFVTGDARSPSLTRDFEHVHAAESEDPDYEAARAAVAWLRETGEPAKAPLFVWLHLSGPAAPWDAAPIGSEDFLARFDDPDYAGGLDGSAQTLARVADGSVELTGLDATHLVACYDAEVARAAHLVQQVATAFAGRHGVLPRDLLAASVVVFASDRGCELFQHGRAAEDPASLYDSSLHVPLFVRHPGSLTGNRVLGALVELADVAPTLADWFDLDATAALPEMDGRSLLALTDSYVERPFAARPIVRRDGERASVRTERWHLLDDGERRMLFDVERDPLEQKDRAALEPAVAQELLGFLAAER